jgi:hypothetical protein
MLYLPGDRFHPFSQTISDFSTTCRFDCLWSDIIIRFLEHGFPPARLHVSLRSNPTHTLYTPSRHRQTSLPPLAHNTFPGPSSASTTWGAEKSVAKRIVKEIFQTQCNNKHKCKPKNLDSAMEELTRCNHHIEKAPPSAALRSWLG